MPGQQGRGLFLPRKDSLETGDIIQTFREIERWANITIINAFRYATNWSDAATFVPGGYFIDPFNIVHLQGELVYAVALPAATFVTITTLPPRFCPPAEVRFNSLYSAGGFTAATPCYIEVTPLGVVKIGAPSGSAGAIVVSLSGFTYPVFK